MRVSATWNVEILRSGGQDGLCHLQPSNEENKLDNNEERQKQVQLRELSRGCLVNIFGKCLQ